MLENTAFLKYLDRLQKELTPAYTPPATPGGYDLNHIFEMIALGPRIKAIPRYSDLDLQKYEVAVWLHNTDRPDAMVALLHVYNPKKQTGDPEWKKKYWPPYLMKQLESSPFHQTDCQEIVDAVVQHSKKDDEEGDPVLLTALRIADKIVRFGPLGMMGQPANRGREVMFYDPERPFEYGSTEEGKMTAVINDYFRVLEWLQMLLKRALTREELWTLVDKRDIADEIHTIRGVGRMIAKMTGKENQIENSLQHALGDLYPEFPPMTLVRMKVMQA